MFTSLVIAAAVSPAAPLPTGAGRAPAGAAPWVVQLKTDDAGQLRLQVQVPRTIKQTRVVIENQNGKQVQKQVVQDVKTVGTSIHTLNDVTGATVDGAPVSGAELVRRAKAGLTVLVSADGKALDRAWLGAVAPGTVVIASEAFAGAVNPPQAPYIPNRVPPATPAPRLTLLTAGPDGTVRVVTRAGGTARSAVVARLALLNNGGAVPLMLDDVYDGPAGGPQEKPLSEVGFDTYELDGRLVPRAEAVRRLRAGGLVLLAADARLPDPAYLGAFRNVLVLVSSEGLAVPGDRTAPPAGGAKPLPALRIMPAVLPAQPLVLPAAPVPAPARLVAPARVVAPARQVLPARPAPAPVPAPAPQVERPANPAG